MPGRMHPQEAKRRKPGAARDAHLEAELDSALEHTFPASDPVSVGRSTGTEPPARPVDRQAPELEIASRSPRRRKPLS